MEQADITQMEQHAADVVAELQAAVSSQILPPRTEPGPAEYLVQTGDSQSVFRFVLNTMRARSRGMRPLVAARWLTEKTLNRLVTGVWVPREQNQPADALANLDIAKFLELMQTYVSSSAQFCRLRVPESVLISPALLRAVSICR